MLTTQVLPALRSSAHSLHENADPYSTLTPERSAEHRNNVPPSLPVLPPGLFSSREDLPSPRSSIISSRLQVLAGSTTPTRSRSLMRGPRPAPGCLLSSQSASSSSDQRHGLPLQGSNIVASKNEEIEESPKFKLRRARIQEMERLQELEDEREFDRQNNLHVLHTLLASRPFSGVTASFEDLDGQGHLWERCSIRRVMKQRWDQCRRGAHYIGDSDGKYPRSIHSLYADLASCSGDIHPCPGVASSTSSTVATSMSMPLMSSCRSFARTVSTIRPRIAALGRKSSVSSTRFGSMRLQPATRSHTMTGITQSGSGQCRSSASAQQTVNESADRGVPMVLAGLHVSTGSRRLHTGHERQLPSSDTSALGSFNVNGRKNTYTLPRMTRTMSGIASDSFGNDTCNTQHRSLLAHADHLAHVAASRARGVIEDEGAEAEMPLMMPARSSSGTSGPSSFGVRPLRIKKTTGLGVQARSELCEGSMKVQTVIDSKAGPPRDYYDDAQEEINIEELEQLMDKVDQSLLWDDVGDEPRSRCPQPPPKPQTRGATWGGPRSSPFILGSTISRASGRGTHSTRRPPLPFPRAMDAYITDPSSLVPLSEILQD